MALRALGNDMGHFEIAILLAGLMRLRPDELSRNGADQGVPAHIFGGAIAGLERFRDLLLP